MKRRRSAAVIERDKPLLEAISRIKGEHPFWGYRRVWSYLRFREKLTITMRRVYRVMRENNLMIKGSVNKALRETFHRSKPVARQPNDYWGIDMTKVMIPSFGWVYLEVVLDWYTKELIGYELAIQSKSCNWFRALEMAFGSRFPYGLQGDAVRLISDNGSQPTSRAFMLSCSALGIEQIFTSYNNPNGNADTERFIRTLKEDLVYPYEYESVEAFREALARWVNSYNEDFPHSALKHLTPREFNQKHATDSKPFAA